MTNENKNTNEFRGMYFMVTEWPDIDGRFAFFDGMTVEELRAAPEGMGPKITEMARTKFGAALPANSFVALCLEQGKTETNHFHYAIATENAISSNTIRKLFLFKDEKGKKTKVESMKGEMKEALINIEKMQGSVGRACEYLDKVPGEFMRKDGTDKTDSRVTGIYRILGDFEDWKDANKRNQKEGGNKYSRTAKAQFEETAAAYMEKYYKNGVFDFEGFEAEAFHAGDKTFMSRFQKLLSFTHRKWMQENGLLVPVSDNFGDVEYEKRIACYGLIGGPGSGKTTNVYGKYGKKSTYSTNFHGGEIRFDDYAQQRCVLVDEIGHIKDINEMLKVLGPVPEYVHARYANVLNSATEFVFCSNGRLGILFDWMLEAENDDVIDKHPALARRFTGGFWRLDIDYENGKERHLKLFDKYMYELYSEYANAKAKLNSRDVELKYSPAGSYSNYWNFLDVDAMHNKPIGMSARSGNKPPRFIVTPFYYMVMQSSEHNPERKYVGELTFEGMQENGMNQKEIAQLLAGTAMNSLTIPFSEIGYNSFCKLHAEYLAEFGEAVEDLDLNEDGTPMAQIAGRIF